MKIHKYWVTEKQKILIDVVEQDITCYGGSNISVEDARVRAKEKAEKVKRKINGKNISSMSMKQRSAMRFFRSSTIIPSSREIDTGLKS